MKQNIVSNISESIYLRWREKLQADKDIPDIIVDKIQKLRTEGKLNDSREILKLISYLENSSKNED